MNYLLLGLGFIPLLAVFAGLRTAAFAYIALIPLYEYHKAMFVVVRAEGANIQLPPLVKDIVGVTLLLLVLAAGLLARQGAVPARARRHVAAILMLLAFGVVCTLAGLARGASPATLVLGLRPYLLYQIAGLALGYVVLSRSRRSWDQVVDLLLWGCGAIAFMTLVQQFVYKRFLIIPALRRVWNGHIVPWSFPERASAFFTSANELGYVMGLGVILVLWRVLFIRNGNWNLLYAALGAAQLYVLVDTLSRASIIGTGVGIVALMRCYRRNTKKGDIGYFIAGAAALWALFLSPVASRFSESTHNPRLTIWASTLASSFETVPKLIFGNGIGTIGRFGAQFGTNSVNIGATAQSLGGDSSGSVTWLDDSALKAVYESGLLGLLLVAWTIALCIRQFRLAARRDPDEHSRATAPLPAALMLYVLVIAIFSVSLYTYPWTFLYWFAAADGYLRLPEKVSSRAAAGRIAPRYSRRGEPSAQVTG